jgi:hypothetical protein
LITRLSPSNGGSAATFGAAALTGGAGWDGLARGAPSRFGAAATGSAPEGAGGEAQP